MMEEEIKESGVKYTDELKSELDDAFGSYKKGEAKMICASESKKRIREILNGGKVK